MHNSKAAPNIHRQKDEGINMSDDFDDSKDSVSKFSPIEKNTTAVIPNQIEMQKQNSKAVSSGATNPKDLEVNRQTIAEPNDDDIDDIQDDEAAANLAITSDYFEDEVVADSKHSSAIANMKLFQKNYGVTFDMPSIYILNSVFYPKNPIYSLQVVIQVIPGSEKYKVHDHLLKSNNSVKSQKNAMINHSEFAMLRLVKLQNYQTEVIDQVELEGNKKALIHFSEDGNLFSLYQPES